MAEWVVNWAWSLKILCWILSERSGVCCCCRRMLSLSLSYVVYRSDFCSVACNHPIDFLQFYTVLVF